MALKRLISILLFALLVRAESVLHCGSLPPPTLFEKLTHPVSDYLSNFFHVSHPDCPDEPNTLSLATWPTYSNSTHAKVAGFAYALSNCSARPAPRRFVLDELLGFVGTSLRPHFIEPFYHRNRSVTYTFNNEIAMMPAEFLAWSVTGANISAAMPIAQPTTPFGEQNDWDNSTMPTDLHAFAKLLASSLDPQTLEFNPDHLTAADLDQSTTQHVSTTNRYGHFEGFVARNRTSPMKTVINETFTLRIDACDSPTSRAEPYSIPLQLKSQPVRALSLPPRGITVVSDIDDILRVSEIWNPKQMLLNTFVRAFRPWSTMPSVFWSWFNTNNDIHFHYSTDAPETVYRSYVDGILSHYPAGTFDFRPMDFATLAQTINSRFENIKMLLETFPHRDFILVGDTATGTVLSAYTKLARMFPSQVKCVVLRDVGATEAAQWIYPNGDALRKLERHVMFSRPSQLTNGSEELFTQLSLAPADFQDADCAKYLHSARTSFTYDGFFSSWAKTEWSLWSEWFACFLVGGHRPHRACVFDRRPGTDYYWGGPPEGEAK